MNNRRFNDNQSHSEQYLAKKDPRPLMSAKIANSVSAFRKEQLAEDVDKGIFRDGSGAVNHPDALTSNSFATASVGFNKSGQVASTGGGGGYRGNAGDAMKQGPEVYSPLWLTSNLSLPRDRATINAWSRSFFALNPVIHNAISLHSTYPISKLSIKCPNKEVERFFNEMNEEIDLMNVCTQIAQEYWLLGEAFIYAELDQSKGKWSRLVIQNPDYMIVQRSVVSDSPQLMLRPDEHLKKIITSKNPRDVEQRNKLNPYIVDAVKRGQNIPLDNYNISYLSRQISPYDGRGTGLPVTVFRQLMLMDLLRESKFAQANNMINPLTVVKIGSADYKPTAADLEAFRQLFESAQYDKDFKIFTHEAVSVERIGYGGGIYDISNDITQALKETYIGLMVPPVLMDGGSDTSYANGGVALDVLKQRYMQFRNKLATWLKRKIFTPISKLQGFYEYKKRGSKSEKQLIIPEVEWNHMALFDAGDYIQHMMTLSTGEGDAKRASLQTLYRSLGLDYTQEILNIRKESVQSVILKKERAALETMSLIELRALDEDDEIKEAEEGAGGAVPGEAGAPDLGGAPPGLDLGGAPPGGPPPPTPV